MLCYVGIVEQGVALTLWTPWSDIDVMCDVSVDAEFYVNAEFYANANEDADADADASGLYDPRRVLVSPRPRTMKVQYPASPIHQPLAEL